MRVSRYVFWAEAVWPRGREIAHWTVGQNRGTINLQPDGNRGVKTVKAPGYCALSTEQPGEWRAVDRSSSYQSQHPRL
jgi:hypothetical protein